MIPRPFFDRPIWTDPLFWFGVVAGLSLSVIIGLRADLPLEYFVWQMLTGTFGVTYAIAGLLLSTIRHQFRRRRLAKERDVDLASD